MLQIFFVSPSISATSPESRSVTENTFFRLTLCSGFFGRLSTGTMSFQDASVSLRLYSGGTSGCSWMYRAIRLISSLLRMSSKLTIPPSVP